MFVTCLWLCNGPLQGLKTVFRSSKWLLKFFVQYFEIFLYTYLMLALYSLTFLGCVRLCIKRLYPHEQMQSAYLFCLAFWVHKHPKLIQTSRWSCAKSCIIVDRKVLQVNGGKFITLENLVIGGRGMSKTTWRWNTRMVKKGLCTLR